MILLVSAAGNTRLIHTDDLDLRRLGNPHIRRASHVEPTSSGSWRADLSPVGGPVLGAFPSRRDALAAEHAWLEEHLHQID